MEGRGHQTKMALGLVIKWRGTIPSANPDRVRNMIFEALAKLWGEAAFYAVKIMVTKVAVDTGMSAASLIYAAEKAGLIAGQIGRGELIETDIAARRKRVQRKGVTPPEGGKSDKSMYKEIKTGIAAGKDFTELEVGTPTAPNFTFIFLINVFQYEFWEPVWGSIEAGLEAFREYWSGNLRRIFPPMDDLFPPKGID